MKLNGMSIAVVAVLVASPAYSDAQLLAKICEQEFNDRFACALYIRGFIEGANAATMGHRFCPTTNNTETLAEQLYRWIRAHPESLGYSWDRTLAGMLDDWHPCN